MNSLTFLLLNIPTPFFVTDGKSLYKIFDSFVGTAGVAVNKYTVLFNNKLKPVLGGWVIPKEELDKRKWILWEKDGELSDKLKNVLLFEPDEKPKQIPFRVLDCVQIKMNI